MTFRYSSSVKAFTEDEETFRNMPGETRRRGATSSLGNSNSTAMSYSHMVM